MRSRSCSASSHEALPPVNPEAPYEAPAEDSTAVNQSASPATEPGPSASAAADPPAAALQFDQVEPVAGAAAAPGLTCLRCRTPLPEQFWEVNGHATCAPCRTALIEQFTGPITWRTWGRVLLYGGGAALLGTLLYFAVLKLTGYEFGLIAIGVGLLVGGAVRKASGLRGGWRMQAAAMAENAEGMQHIHGSLQVLQQVGEQLDVSASALAEKAQHLAGHASAFHTG